MQREVKWSIPLLRKSLDTFLKKDFIRTVANENFAVVISAPEDEGIYNYASFFYILFSNDIYRFFFFY